MIETNTKETLGLLEAVLIIHEMAQNNEDFTKAVRRIQRTIEKGVTDTADQADGNT